MTLAPGRRPLVVGAVLLFALAALIFGLPAARAVAQSRETVTLAEYQARLEQARAALAAALTTGAAGPGAQQAVEQAAVDLYAVRSVLLPDGRRADIEPLVIMSNTPEEALARLDIVLTQLQAASADNADARFASLDKVLQSDEMNRGGGLRAWLLRLLARLFSRDPSDAITSGLNALDTVLTVVAALVLVFVLGRILHAALGSFLHEADVRREGEGGERPTVAGARRRAADLAQAGSYREAVRQLYLATLLGLEDRGLLRLDRSLTNREVLASVGRWSDVQGGLRPVVDTFEIVWYGEREPDRETFERYSAEVASAANLIERAAPQAAGASPAPTPAEDV